MSDTKLSAHFTLDEFADPRTGEAKVDPRLVQLLEVLRAELGHVPIRITSGYRSPDTNRAAGGASDSEHLTGRAADIDVAGKSPREVAAVARRVGFTGVGTYSAHVHVDVRPGPVTTWAG